MLLAALNITMRIGLGRVGDVDAASAVIAAVAFVLVAPAAAVFGSGLGAGGLWPFVLLGAFVPGASQLFVVHAVQGAGASRAGILFGTAPLFSAAIAIGAFDEPLRWPLVVGTLLVVAGGVVLAWEPERPVGYRTYGAVLAVSVAVMFGLRDNVARAVGDDLAADALAQTAALMLGASLFLVGNLVLRGGPALARFRAALPAFALSGLVTALAQACLLAALARARVTVAAPLMATGVLWTVVFAAVFLGRSELVGRRLALVAVLVVAGSTLVGALR
jgi:drug/metabolite transporter (DMT)-like permease